MTWNDALQTLWFSINAANNVVTTQGITLDDTLFLEDDDITNLC